jgi:glycosyltransferase involved in cell wall biosynthesis
VTVDGLLTISVVIPAWNAGDYVAATLQSVRAQGTQGVEVILVDGGSTDDTVAIAQSFGDLSIKIVSERDEGQLDALQKGLRLATGDIVLWLNADDLVMPSAFATVRCAFVAHDPDFVFSDDCAFDEARRTFYYGPTIKGLNDWDHFLFYRQMYSECVYWKRSIMRYLPPDAYKLRVYTDYAFFLNLRWRRRGHWVPQRLGAFRIRSGQASAEFREGKESEFDAIRNQHREMIGQTRAAVQLLRLAYWPWFFVRQQIVPQVKRGARKLYRIVSGDCGRARQTEWFFRDWLLPLGSRGSRF